MKNMLPILLPMLVLLLLVFVFFDRIPLLGSGDLGIYPFLLFILIMLILAIRQNIPKIKDYGNYFSSFSTSGSKLLFFRGYSAVGGPVGSRGYGGYSRIKLSDGRKIKIWSSPFAGMVADVFSFKGAGNKGEIRKEKILLNGVDYSISSKTDGVTIHYNNSDYTINDRALFISKNETTIAKFEKFPSGTYIETTLVKELTPDEFLLINLFLMDVYLFYIPRMVVAL